MSYLDFTGKPVQRPTEVRPAVSAVILDKRGEVLLQKRADNGFWALPGGFVDIGESIEQAVMREVLEETGLRVVVNRVVGVYSDPQRHAIASYPDGNVIQVVGICFECSAETSELRLSSESTDIHYFPPDDLPTETMPRNRVCIRDALEKRPEAFIR
jgi:ADP-ribose pyrophosphatase YjhB (NUDIX family)